MPARNLPTPQDAATARRILPGGLARDSKVSELVGELAPLHPRNNTFPGEVFRHVAVDVLDEVAWWQTDDFWQYALYAAVAYIRAAASRAGAPVRRVCQELAQRDGPRPG